ncbi:hypothetical protein IWZ00DRAFT_488915 [Phyllosticta capitalensis]|uniref:uncharacterized protein n=1 Tax=Phyllosticta capitalensis TaxID=121624 RepID=UPI0031309086
MIARSRSPTKLPGLGMLANVAQANPFVLSRSDSCKITLIPPQSSCSQSQDKPPGPRTKSGELSRSRATPGANVLRSNLCLRARNSKPSMRRGGYKLLHLYAPGHNVLVKLYRPRRTRCRFRSCRLPAAVDSRSTQDAGDPV